MMFLFNWIARLLYGADWEEHARRGAKLNRSRKTYRKRR